MHTYKQPRSNGAARAGPAAEEGVHQGAGRLWERHRSLLVSEGTDGVFLHFLSYLQLARQRAFLREERRKAREEADAIQMEKAQVGLVDG